MKRRTSIIALIVVLLTVSIVYGTVFSGVESISEEARFENIGHVTEVVALIKSRYYKPVSTFELLRSYVTTGTINGMIAEAVGDPYTNYMDQESYQQMVSRNQGAFGGIGIVVGMREEQLTIISPIRSTPGERAGLRSNDKIIAIDGKTTKHMSLNEAVSLMRGDPGTGLTITVLRNEEQLEVPIVRAIINVDSVSEVKMFEHNIGYFDLATFSDRTYQEVRQALATLDAQGMQALIMDLRFNPGGTLSASLQIANEFIGSGPLVYLEDRNGNRTGYEASSRGTRKPIPIVILLNGSSASASEIVAGALRDHQLATLVGTTTFGKGLVQTVYPLRDGSALTVTEQAYLTAGGHDINKVGIVPDIIVEVSDEEAEAIFFNNEEVEDRQLQKALEVLLEQLQ